MTDFCLYVQPTYLFFQCIYSMAISYSSYPLSQSRLANIVLKSNGERLALVSVRSAELTIWSHQPINVLDTLSAAEFGNSIIISPNCSFLYEPLTLPCSIQLQYDYHFGTDDLTLYPSMDPSQLQPTYHYISQTQRPKECSHHYLVGWRQGQFCPSCWCHHWWPGFHWQCSYETTGGKVHPDHWAPTRLAWSSSLPYLYFSKSWLSYVEDYTSHQHLQDFWLLHRRPQ